MKMLYRQRQQPKALALYELTNVNHNLSELLRMCLNIQIVYILFQCPLVGDTF